MCVFNSLLKRYFLSTGTHCKHFKSEACERLPYRFKMAAQVFQPGEALVAGLAGVRPLARVAAQVALQVRLPLDRVRAEGTLVAHGGVGV